MLQTVDDLRPEAVALQNTRSHGFLMPDEAQSVFRKWQENWHRGRLSLDKFCIAAAIAYYGPPDSELTQERLSEILEYVEKWSGPPFRPEDLPQLVFAWGLGLHRDVGPGPWDERWGPAVFSLKNNLLTLETWVADCLSQLGLGGAVTLDGTLEHLFGVLLDITESDYVEWMTNLPGRKFRQEDAQRRHRLYHSLNSWLDRSGWPDEVRWKTNIFPISRFVIRALGGRPDHPRDFEKGLLFRWLRVSSELDDEAARLIMVNVLTCKQCKKPATLEGCATCNHSEPDLKKRPWLIREKDERWERQEVWYCRELNTFCCVDNEGNGQAVEIPPGTRTFMVYMPVA